MRNFLQQLPALAATLLAPVPLAAHEWDARWPGDSYVLAQPQTTYQNAAPAADGSGWVADNSGGVTRFSAAATVIARMPATDLGGTQGSTRVLRSLPDGGALLLVGTHSLRAIRVDAQGRTIWHRPAVGDGQAVVPAADDRGSLWCFYAPLQSLRKLAPDGEQHFSLSLSDLGLASIQALAVSPDGALALIAGADLTSGNRIASALVSADGVVLSRWTGPSVTPASIPFYPAAVLDADHALLAFANSSGRLVVASHSRHGTPTLSTQNEAFNPGGYRMLSTGNNYALASKIFDLLDHHVFLQFLDTSGASISAHNLPAGTDLASLIAAPDGAIWALGFPVVSGRLQLSRALPGSVEFGSIEGFLRTQGFPILAPTATDIVIASSNQLFRASLAGQLSALPSNFDITIAMTRSMATTDAEGNSYVIQRLDQRTSAEGATLTRIDRDGSVRWSVAVAPDAQFPSLRAEVIDSTGIAANAERVCYAPGVTTHIYCHDSANGSLQSGIVLPSWSAGQNIELTARNHLLVRRRLSGAEPAMAFDADNSLIAPSEYTPDMMLARLSNSRGQYLQLDEPTNLGVRHIHRRWRGGPDNMQPEISWDLGGFHAPSIMRDGQPSLLLLEDGSALLLSIARYSEYGNLQLRKLNADGSFGFSVDMEFTGSFYGFDLISEIADLAVVDNRVFVSFFFKPNNYFIHTPGSHELHAFALAHGERLWAIQSPAESLSAASMELKFEADGRHALRWTSAYGDIAVRRIRLSDGVEVARTDFPCTPFCLIDRVLTDARGTTLLPSIDRREHDPFVPRVRADQEILEGAWYQSQTSGQGVLFDYIPQTRTWFGTWHTSLGDGRANLRWFTVQGEANADGSEATLGIYLASAGQFDSGPTISSTRIGTARLSFDTCSSANLQYEFSSGELNGKLGSIPLRTLTPHAGGCAALDQPPAQIVASERTGIGTRHSGTW